MTTTSGRDDQQDKPRTPDLELSGSWKCVPAEPTGEMLFAARYVTDLLGGEENEVHDRDGAAENAWRAMIDVASATPNNPARDLEDALALSRRHTELGDYAEALLCLRRDVERFLRALR